MKSLEYIAKLPTFAPVNAEIAQLVEHNLAKVRVASSSLVFRSQEKATQVVFSFFYAFFLQEIFWGQRKNLRDLLFRHKF